MLNRYPNLVGFRLLMVLSELRSLKHLQLVISIMFVGLIDTLAHHSASGQIVPDTNWGTENSIVTPNATVKGQSAILIEGGAARSSNLFHSFQTFSIGSGERVYFASPAGVQNILSRVTGRMSSEIFGTLGVDGSANLFLINPNGVVFGANAQLDVAGSFMTTTANAIQFGDQGVFAVSNPQPPSLLTINPSALLYDQIATQPILNRSTANGKGLQAAPGQSLLFVGGAIQLEGGQISAPGGRVELASVQAGTVGLTLVNNQWQLSFPDTVQRGDVLLSNNAQVNVRSNGGGDILIHAQDFSMTGSNTALLAGIDTGLGSAGTQAGSIEIDATGAVNLDDSLVDNSVLSNAVGSGGDIKLYAHSISLMNGAIINTDLFGKGNLGEITINARENFLIDERGGKANVGISSNVNSRAEGRSSNINIHAESLLVRNGGRIATSTRGRGDAGKITIHVNETVSMSGLSRRTRLTSGIFSTVATRTAVGNAGSITINTGSLSLSDGASLRSFTLGTGNGGDITINARDVVAFNSNKPQPNLSVGGIISLVGDGAIGNGGNVKITTGSLFLRNGTSIDASTVGKGNAGNITIVARDTASWDGVDSEGFASSATSSVDKILLPRFSDNGEGNGGTITVIARNVSLTNGGRLDASISNAPGKAGGIAIQAERVTLAGASLEIGISSGLFTSTAGTTNAPGGEIRISADSLQISDGAFLNAVSQSDGEGGDIRIEVNDLEMRTGGALITTTSGRGRAGDILVTAFDRIDIAGSDPYLLERQNNFNTQAAEFPRFLIATSPFSGMFANTEVASGGQGGTIAIQTGDLRLQDSGQISVGSQGEGIAGQIDIAARSLQLSNQARLTAETTNSTGGNITLNLQEGLLLRRNSLISATAGTAALGGDGGNIRISTPFIVTTALENSDITANAFSGRGGRVEVDTLALFNLVPRSRLDLENLLQTTDPLLLNPQLLPTNDITAISQTNPSLSGDISINTPAVDLTQTVVELPEVPVDVAGLIDQQLCAVAQGSQFVLTGRGGLPDTPTAPPNTRVAMLNTRALWEDWRIEQDSQMNQSLPEVKTHIDSQQVESHRSKQIVEAQGWVKTADNIIQLVVASPQTTLLATQFTNPGCNPIAE